MSHRVAIFVLMAAAAIGSLEAAAQEPPSYKPGPILKKMLDGPMKTLDEIVFAVRPSGRDHWYVNFGNYATTDPQINDRAWMKDKDGVLWGYPEGGRLCRFNLRTGELKVLLDDPKGGVRDPQMHYDGKKILFSYRPGGTHVYHLYEIDIDGTNLTQLTSGPDDDIEPTYCPDGTIVFGSSRCRRFVNCWFSRVAVLYRCDADGSNIRAMSSNNDHDNTPWTLPDGRVLYMRWEYVDRSQVHFHHLWTTNPDGTNQTVFYGNMFGGVAMLDAKPVPDSRKIVASFSPGHGRFEHMGYVTLLDPRLGPDDPKAVQRISKSSQWRDPYAITDDCFLVAMNEGIYVMNGSGEYERIYACTPGEQKLHCHEPRPLRARPREKQIPDRTQPELATGRLVLEDVYQGRKMSGVERGTITKMLVLKQLPKPVNYSGGMQPLTIGGSFTLAEIVGTGELTSCVGCHEQRVRTPHAVSSDLMALRQPPRPVAPITDVPPVLDFPRDIQPILDRHCTECHNADRREGGFDLTGDKTVRYTMSYWSMQRGLISDGRNRPESNYAPYTYGSVASRLMKLIDGTHHDAKLSPLEVKTVRLWIETSATYPGTYASLGSGLHPVWLPREEMKQRCGECHAKEVDDKYGKRTVLFYKGGTSERLQSTVNISRPEKSYVLLAPLAKSAGGKELCGRAIFESTDDPVYKLMLQRIRDGQKRMQTTKRFDMPGFRPDKDYIREMQRFGFIPKDIGPNDPIDIYAVDRAYWDSFLCPNVLRQSE